MGSENKDPPPTGVSGSQSRSALYANLLNNESSISRGPVVFAQANGRDGQQGDSAAMRSAALRFQPTKRPLPGNKAKQKPAFSKIQAPQTLATSTSDSAEGAAPGPPAPASKSTLADWTVEDDAGFYVGEKRQRGGRKKRKKNKEPVVVVQDWDDIYDPSRPNVYEDYIGSEEQYREIKEWKDHLYKHRLKTRRSSDVSDDSDRPARNMNRSFAPPQNYSFAPPADLNTEPQDANLDETGDMPPPPPPAVDVPNDETGDDAYARRMRLSGMPQQPTDPPPPPPPADEPTPPAPPPNPTAPKDTPPAGTISRAPVRYQLPAAPTDLPTSEAELQDAVRDADEQGENESVDSPPGDADRDNDAPPRSNRPGQRGFAERLMGKYGWTKGSGLGAAGTGIVNPLRVQVEKRKKRSDAEGGGFVGPAAKGKIIGSRLGKGDGGSVDGSGAGEDEGSQGPTLSEVVVLRGMVDGLDLDAELGDGNLMQEIGEECEEKYGRVERVFIHRASTDESVPVFVKFTSQLSALRAMQALQGRIFNGNAINAQYFDPEKFEAGIYE